MNKPSNQSNRRSVVITREDSSSCPLSDDFAIIRLLVKKGFKDDGKVIRPKLLGKTWCVHDLNTDNYTYYQEIPKAVNTLPIRLIDWLTKNNEMKKEQINVADDCPNERLVTRYFAKGMTVRELKELIKDWPETNSFGEECEVWIKTGKFRSNFVTTAGPLNLREDEDGAISADFILESNAFENPN